MANVSVTCRNFTGTFASVNGARLRNYRHRSILRAFMTVGMQRFSDVWAQGWRGWSYHFGMGVSALSLLERSARGLVLSSQHVSLDMSEKGASSYWYGMAFAKLAAESELDIPWLCHVDLLKDRGVLQTTAQSKSRGDLAGLDRHGLWHVVEAKGRSNSYPDSEVIDAKQQASRITTVAGQPPSTTSACITSLFTTPISVLLDDPPAGNNPKNEKWGVNQDGFLRLYYESLIKFIRRSPFKEMRFAGRSYVTCPLLPETLLLPYYPHWAYEFSVGLISDIFESPSTAMQSVQSLKEYHNGKIGMDGIAIFSRRDYSGTN